MKARELGNMPAAPFAYALHTGQGYRTDVISAGMSIRMQLAAMVMQGFIADGSHRRAASQIDPFAEDPRSCIAKLLSANAFVIADALLAEAVKDQS